MRSVIRILSFFRQWLAEVARQPMLMVALILGPFVILLLFGLGETLGAPRPRTVVVTPAQQQPGDPLQVSIQEVRRYVTVVGTTTNEQQARADLVAGRADVVLIIPANADTLVSKGQHIPLRVLTNIIDPISASYADAYLREQVAGLNQQAVQRAVAQIQQEVGNVHQFVGQAQGYLDQVQAAEGQVDQAKGDLANIKQSLDPLVASLDDVNKSISGSALSDIGFLSPPIQTLQQLTASMDALKRNVDALNAQLANATNGNALPTPQHIAQIRTSLNDIDTAATQLRTIPADVLSAPFTLTIENVAPSRPSAIAFYSPAVLALLVQHLAITLGALSIARVRLLGLVELFQTSPVTALEVSVGQYFSYGVLVVLAGGVLLALLVFALGVPVFGSVVALIGTLALLMTCSLGIGFVISLISSSDQQAVQLAMLVLIASVFFSGFLVTLETIEWPVRAVSYVLPATYAIRTLQDVMLRGVLRTPGDLAVLGAASAVLFVVTVLLVRRELRPR